jgi:hypothetical protein
VRLNRACAMVPSVITKGGTCRSKSVEVLRTPRYQCPSPSESRNSEAYRIPHTAKVNGNSGPLFAAVSGQCQTCRCSYCELDGPLQTAGQDEGSRPLGVYSAGVYWRGLGCIRECEAANKSTLSCCSVQYRARTAAQTLADPHCWVWSLTHSSLA